MDGEITSDKIIIVVEELESWCLTGIDTSIDEYADFVIPENTDDKQRRILMKYFQKLHLINHISSFKKFQ